MKNSPVVEGWIDEFYDDVDSCRDWLCNRDVVTSGLDYDELCDLFVKHSLQEML